MNQTALLIIDMQKAYFRNEALEAVREKLITHCNQLIGWGKSSGLLVLSIKTLHQRDGTTWTLNMKEDDQGYLFNDDEESGYVDGLAVEDVPTIIKTRDSAFYCTDLEETLRRHKITHLVLAGVSTHSCVMLTAADAYARNLKVTLVQDAIASHDEAYHQPVLDMLRQEYRHSIITTKQVTET